LPLVSLADLPTTTSLVDVHLVLNSAKAGGGPVFNWFDAADSTWKPFTVNNIIYADETSRRAATPEAGHIGSITGSENVYLSTGAGWNRLNQRWWSSATDPNTVHPGIIKNNDIWINDSGAGGYAATASRAAHIRFRQAGKWWFPGTRLISESDGWAQDNKSTELFVIEKFLADSTINTAAAELVYISQAGGHERMVLWNHPWGYKYHHKWGASFSADVYNFQVSMIINAMFKGRKYKVTSYITILYTGAAAVDMYVNTKHGSTILNQNRLYPEANGEHIVVAGEAVYDHTDPNGPVTFTFDIPHVAHSFQWCNAHMLCEDIGPT